MNKDTDVLKRVEDYRKHVIKTIRLKRPYKLSNKDWEFCKNIKINLVSKGSLYRNNRVRLGVSIFSIKEIFVDIEAGDYALYHELGHVLVRLHAKDMLKYRELVENAYILENKKFVTNSVYRPNTYYKKFMEYLAQAYSVYVLHPYGFKRRYPYTYKVFVKVGIIQDKVSKLPFEYSLLNVALRMTAKEDYYCIRNYPNLPRNKLCMAMLYGGLEKLVKEEVSKAKRRCDKEINSFMLDDKHKIV